MAVDVVAVTRYLHDVLLLLVVVESNQGDDVAADLPCDCAVTFVFAADRVPDSIHAGACLVQDHRSRWPDSVLNTHVPFKSGAGGAG